jgi:hypothetical protein
MNLHRAMMKTFLAFHEFTQGNDEHFPCFSLIRDQRKYGVTFLMVIYLAETFSGKRGIQVCQCQYNAIYMVETLIKIIRTYTIIFTTKQ